MIIKYYVLVDLVEEFESRVEKFIQVNIESDDCSHWVDILRLEFGGEDKFCGDGFINAVSELKISFAHFNRDTLII